MTDYFRPLVQTGRCKPDDALMLAGGWCWFDRVAHLERGRDARIISAGEVPVSVLDRLTAPRADIAGISMAKPGLMGVLNVTPDSFSDGGRFQTADTAVAHAKAMAAAGADILDVGGESTRPGADFVPAEDEIARTEPVIRALAAANTSPISIDTRKATVAGAALDAGARLLNDVSALTYDVDMASTAARADVPICLMHAQGDPKTMQDRPAYNDVLLDVYDFLEERLVTAEKHGISRDRVILDPGIGFGKATAHNLALIAGISIFHSLGCPLLLGASRKRFIGRVGGEPEADKRLAGSLAVALAGLREGVQIMRVHDISETRQAVALAMAVIEG